MENIHVHTVGTGDRGGGTCPDKEREEKLVLLLHECPVFLGASESIKIILLCFPYCTSLCKATGTHYNRFIPTIKSRVDVLEAQGNLTEEVH